MSATVHCTDDCERVATCTVCGLHKPPVGRSVAPEAATGYCQHECKGHDLPPHSGHLWPGELARTRNDHD